jgi:hypothetical protein
MTQLPFQHLDDETHNWPPCCDHLADALLDLGCATVPFGDRQRRVIRVQDVGARDFVAIALARLPLLGAEIDFFLRVARRK